MTVQDAERAAWQQGRPTGCGQATRCPGYWLVAPCLFLAGYDNLALVSHSKPRQPDGDSPGVAALSDAETAPTIKHTVLEAKVAQRQPLHMVIPSPGLVSPGILGCNNGIPLALLTTSASMTNSSISPARTLLQDLQARFAVFRDAQPLAIGIDAAILLQLPELDRQVLRSALRQHTASTRYLKALQAANHRVDLDGNVAGEVSEAQRNHAAETLKARFQKSAQLQKEKAEAAAAAARQQEKLTQLAAKFSR